MTRAKEFTDPAREREIATWNMPHPFNRKIVEHGGWHFSYLGDNNFAKTKLTSYAHSECNIPKIVDNVDVDYMIANRVGLERFDSEERFEIVKLDEYFPKTVLDNLDQYQHIIAPGANHSVYDFYLNV